MQPFERIKVMLQTQGPVKEHKGILDCIQKVMKQEGIAGFYKGTLVPLMGIGLIGSVRFGVFEMIKRHMHQDLNIRDAHGNLPLEYSTLAAFCTGTMSSLLIVSH
jgi:hypothetical protein